MSEQDLLDQIQKLAGTHHSCKISLIYLGAINRYKDNRADSGTWFSTPNQRMTTLAASTRGRGASLSRRPYRRNSHFDPLKTASYTHPYSRGRGTVPVSRHRTLIVNQPKSTDDSSSESAANTTNSQWVTKRDRHLQLINASVYEERTQARQHDIQETKKQRLLNRQAKRDKLERTRLYSFLKRKGQGNQISICGNLYQVTAQGNKLEKFQGMGFRRDGSLNLLDNGGSSIPPRKIKVGGVSFHRSKNGNYWRRGVVTASRTKSFQCPSRESLIACRSTDKKDKLCRYFTKTGTCHDISIPPPDKPPYTNGFRILRKRAILPIHP
jgi:hypothetical protein